MKLRGGSNPGRKPAQYRAFTALSYAPECAGVLGLDLFSGQTMALAQPPWPESNPKPFPRAWTDDDVNSTMLWLHENGINVGKRTAFRASSGRTPLPPGARLAAVPKVGPDSAHTRLA